MAATFVGEFRGGVVVFDGAPPLREGTKVWVAPVELESEVSDVPTLAERLKPVIGASQGLPSDLAVQYDHYLHGLPKG